MTAILLAPSQQSATVTGEVANLTYEVQYVAGQGGFIQATGEMDEGHEWDESQQAAFGDRVAQHVGELLGLDRQVEASEFNTWSTCGQNLNFFIDLDSDWGQWIIDPEALTELVQELNDFLSADCSAELQAQREQEARETAEMFEELCG